MAVIVGPPSVAVELFTCRSSLPSVDVLRPQCCPMCGGRARRPGEPLGIVGHGSYVRQVLGLAQELAVVVRRYRCRGCTRTISVLPDGLYPGRWFAGVAIVIGLLLKLIGGDRRGEIRERSGCSREAHAKTLGRWQHQIVDRMWSWFGPRAGEQPGPTSSRDEHRRRLVRMLTLHGAGPPDLLDEVETAAIALVRRDARRALARNR